MPPGTLGRFLEKLLSESKALTPFQHGASPPVIRGPETPSPGLPVLAENDRLFFLSPRLLNGLMTGPIQAPYKNHPWVFTCINAISTNIAGVELRFWTGPRRDRKAVENGPVVDLFAKPNPMMNGRQLIGATSIFMELVGEACWICERPSPFVLPKEIWTFDPRRFKHNVDPRTGLITGWIYKRGIQEVPFAPHEVIHFRYFNPYDDYRGLSPLQAAAVGIEADWYASHYNRNFFLNSAQPLGIVSVPGYMTTPQFNRYRSQWEDKHQGVSRAHSTAFLEGGATYTQMGLSQRDMEFLNQKKWNRDEILAIYRVPKAEIGLFEEGAGTAYASAEIQDRNFWTKTLMPKMGLLEGGIDGQVLDPIPQNQIWSEFDYKSIEALQAEFNKQVETGYKMWQMGWPINAINGRLDLGMEAVPWGDTGYGPVNLLPLDGSAAPIPAPAKTQATGPAVILCPHCYKEYFEGKPCPNCGLTPAPELPPKFLTAEAQNADLEAKAAAFFSTRDALAVIRDKGLRAELRAAAARRYSNDWIQHLQPYEEKFASKFKRFFYAQRARQLKRLESMLGKAYQVEKALRSSYIEGLLLNKDQEDKALQDMATPIYLAIAEGTGQKIYTDLGFDPGGFIVPDIEAIAALKDKLIKVTGINYTIREEIRNQITEGLASLETTAQIMDRVRGTYNFAQNRTLTIARTETGQAASIARDKAFDNLGVETQIWITAGDEAVRLTHQANNLIERKRGEEFPNGLIYPCQMEAPAGEVINCRCALAPGQIKESQEGGNP